MKTLFIITGAVCSGKSTLSKKLQDQFNIPLFNEGNFGNLNNAIKNLNNCNLDYAILEHCDVLYNLEKLPKCNKKIFVLKVDNKLLKTNYENRKKLNAIGDYFKIDPIKQQTEILAKSTQCDVIEILNQADYELALSKIKKSVMLRLPKQKLDNKSLKQTKQFKDKYFDYYDDVKSNTHDVYDW